MPTVPMRILDWVKTAVPLDGKICNIEQLKGSTSTTLFKITTDTDSYVLRIYDNQNWLEKEPDLATHEKASLIKAAHITKKNIRVPEVIKVDESGIRCGVPAVLMGFVPGHVDLSPRNLDHWLKELARVLSEIHQIEPDELKWDFFRYNEPCQLTIPSWTKHPVLWEKGIKRIKGNPPLYKEVFIHRDYHPVNVLWENERLISVVDWVNACRGPAAIDVGHCRNNLVCLFGVEAADIFQKYYQEYAGSSFTYDTYWDLVCYFDFVYPGPPEVYQGWVDFGLTHLNDTLISERLEHYLTTLIN